VTDRAGRAPETAAVIAVGSELLGSFRSDTNSLWLASRLEASGIRLVRKACVGDDSSSIGAELTVSLGAARIVLLTGGLGPTGDDRTREAVASRFGLSMRTDPAILAALRERFAARGLRMPAINEKQALVIDGSRPLPNPRGSAPGTWLEVNDRVVVLLPGVPGEMKGMFDELVLPEIERRFGGGRVHRRVLHIAAMGESSVEERVAPVYAKWPGREFTILGGAGKVDLYLSAEGEGDAAGELLDAQTRDFEEALPGRIFGRDDETLESAVGDALRRQARTVATAESCTGGLIAETLTRVPGSSDYFLGGVVAYSNRAKQDLLGVRGEALERDGAVSESVALEMARGACARFASDFAISATGIAGPGGGTEAKPVGTVWIGLAESGGREQAMHLRLGRDRHTVRAWTCRAAMEMLRRRLLGA
jgi:nicotinamide-nucleotide amidase